MRDIKNVEKVAFAIGPCQDVDPLVCMPSPPVKPQENADYTRWLKENELLAKTEEEERRIDALAEFITITTLTVKEGGPPVDREKIQSLLRRTLGETERDEVKTRCKTFRAWFEAFDEEARKNARLAKQKN